MLSRIRAALDWLDDCPDWVFLIPNSAVAALVLLAHGGALVITRSGRAPALERFVPLLVVSISVASVVLATAIVALIVQRIRGAMLKFHGVVLAVFATATLGAAAYWVVGGIPSGSFAWTPGFLTGFALYSAYLLRRAFLVHSRSHRQWLVLLPIWVGGLAFVLDCGLGIRFAHTVFQLFSGGRS